MFIRGKNNWQISLTKYWDKTRDDAGKYYGFRLAECLWACVGVTIGIGVVTYLTFLRGIPVLVASLAASACIIFTRPRSVVAQPRHVIGGQVLSAVIGVIIYHLWGSAWYTATLSVSLSVAFMLVTDTMHPPAAATAIIAVVTEQRWMFPLLPVGVGATILVISGVFINNLAVGRRYPCRWWQ